MKVVRSGMEKGTESQSKKLIDLGRRRGYQPATGGDSAPQEGAAPEELESPGRGREGSRGRRMAPGATRG
jgi:hypothetical protein